MISKSQGKAKSDCGVSLHLSRGYTPEMTFGACRASYVTQPLVYRYNNGDGVRGQET